MSLRIRLIFLILLLFSFVDPALANYSIDRSYTYAGSSLWGSGILKMEAQVSGNYLFVTAKKSDGGSFSSSGTMYLKVGSPESYGATRVSTQISAGASSSFLSHNMASYTGYPKAFYIRYQSNDGGWAWVGPINVTYTEPTPVTPPTPSASATSQTSVSVSWSSVLNADKYALFRATSAFGSYTQIQCSGDRARNDSGSHLSPDTYYYYKMKAGNSQAACTSYSSGTGWSGFSGYKSVKTDSYGNPYVSSLSLNQTISSGNSYRLSGTVYAGSGDRLNKVTAAVTGPGISFSNSTAMTSGSISSSSYSLSNFTFHTSTFSTAGTYTVGIWADTQAHPAKLIGQFSVVVTSNPPSLTSLSSNQVLTAGESYRLQGSVNAGSGDRLTKVTAAVTGPGISVSNTTAMTSGSINSDNYSLSNFNFNTSTFSTPGNYTVGIWAVTQSYGTKLLGQFSVSVSAGQATVNGLSINQTLIKGSNYQLQGIVSAGSNDKLTTVTAAVTGPGISTSNVTSMTSGLINTSSFNLNSFIFDTSIFTQAGTYTVGIWAKTNYYSTPTKEVLKFTITVSLPSVPALSGLSQDQELSIGNSYKLEGIVSASSGDRLTKVTAAVLKEGESTSDIVSMTSGIINRTSFNLTNFSFDTSTFNEEGIYSIGIWVKTSAYPEPVKSIGQFTIAVKKNAKYLNVSSWAQDSADFMVQSEIIDNTFNDDLRGTSAINRAELATMVYRALGDGKSNADSQFAIYAGTVFGPNFFDVNDASVWYYNAVTYLSHLRFNDAITAFDSEASPLFSPGETISRTWVLKAILESWDIAPITSYSGIELFNDVPISHPAAGYIYSAVQHGLIGGDDVGNTYRPDDLANREDLFVIIHRLLDRQINLQNKQLDKPEINTNDFNESFSEGDKGIGTRYEQPICYGVTAPSITIQKLSEGTELIGEAELFVVNLKVNISAYGDSSCVDANQVTHNRNLFASWSADSGVFIDETSNGDMPFSRVRWIAPDRYHSGLLGEDGYSLTVYVGNNLGSEVSDQIKLKVNQNTASNNLPTVSLDSLPSQVNGSELTLLQGMATDSGNADRSTYGIREVLVEYSIDGVEWVEIDRNIPVDSNNRWSVEWLVPDIAGTVTVKASSRNIEGRLSSEVNRTASIIPVTRISGYVLDGSGNTLENARVTLSGLTSSSVFSDNTGAFTFSGIAIGSYLVQAHQDDLQSAEQSVVISIDNPKQNLQIIAYSLTPDLVVTTPGLSGELLENTEVGVTATVNNNGGGSLDSGRVDIFASSDPQIDTEDQRLGSFDFNSTEGAQSWSLSSTIILPSLGRYWVFACVFSSQNDANIDNNCSILNKIDVVGVTTTIDNIFPVDVIQNQSVVFRVSGVNLPSSLTFELAGCSNIVVFPPTDTESKFKCKPTLSGQQSGSIKSAEGDLLKSFIVSVNQPVVTNDNDGDGVEDDIDTDDDNDGMPDVWELANGLDPYDAGDAMADSDGDNVINLDEYRANTNPQSQDSDNDGINDDLDQVVGSGFWGYACNVVNDPNSSTRRWGINQYNLADLPNATGTPVYSMSKNRTIQSVACAPSGESVLFSMKDSVRGDYEIYELETASGLVTQITDNDTDDADVTRSRDGRTVAWQMRLADGRQAVELRQYQDNGEFTSAILASANPFVQPSLSPNGEWLTFVQLRPSSFAVMRYDIVNGKYKEVRVIARRKKLYHPSITDDGNKVGWSERTSMLRYRVKDLAEDTTTDVVYNVNGVEHAVLSGDGKHVIYSVNTAGHAETYLTALETLETMVIGETLNNPVRYLSNNWLGSLASNGFALNQVSGRHLRSVKQSMTLWLKNNGSGVRYTLGSDDAVAFTWQLANGVLTLTEQGGTSVRVIRLLAATGNQFTVSMISPDGQGGVDRLIDTLYQE